jgi:HNH endonuclease
MAKTSRTYFTEKCGSIAEKLAYYSMPVTETGCVVWLSTLLKNGYGRVSIEGKQRLAHVVAYETFVGPIPPGMELDHVCRVRCCINPDHLEPVTRKENVLRGNAGRLRRKQTLCRRGHDLSADNVYIKPNGNRCCKLCRSLTKRRYRDRLIAQGLPVK